MASNPLIVGLNVADALETPFGFPVSDTFLTISNSNVQVGKDLMKSTPDAVLAQSTVQVWSSREASLDPTKVSIMSVPFCMTLSAEQTANVYGIMYEHMATWYTGVTPVVQEPAEEPAEEPAQNE